MRNIIKDIILIFIVLTYSAFITGDTKSGYKAPDYAVSVFAADIDLDKDIDIIVGHQNSWGYTNPSVSVLKNDGKGYFEFSDTSLTFCGYQENISAVNIDNDNFPDIITIYKDFTDTTCYIRIYYNDGTGSYTNFKIFEVDCDIDWEKITYGDINGDGHYDIIWASNQGKLWGFLYNDGIGNFSTPEYNNLVFSPQDIRVGDLNNDKFDDIVIAGNTKIFYGDSTNFDEYNYNENTFKIDIADMDNDGDNDIIDNAFLMGAETGLNIFENKGYKDFVIHELPHFQPATDYFKICDLNNDSLPEIILIGYSSSEIIYILYNEGNFTFKQPVSFTAHNGVSGGIYCADFDNNGFNDIVIVRRGYEFPYNNILIFFNDGKGNFQNEPIDINKVHTTGSQRLLKCYPNPFQTEITFELYINQTAIVELSVYDIQGKLVYCLTNKKMEKGTHNIKWSGHDSNGKTCKPGIYMANLTVNGKILKTNKILKTCKS